MNGDSKETLRVYAVRLFLSSSFILILLTFMVGCSLVSGRKPIAQADEKSAAADKIQMVPKTQYDQLLSKYESLLRASRDKELKQAASPADAIVSDLGALEPTAELAETVDVFGNKGLERKKTTTTIPSTLPVQDEEITNQVEQIKKVERLVQQNRFNEALEILSNLENSSVKQIMVRARFYVGEVLFTQGEYDLAMQKFEEIVGHHAFSGVVLKTLGRLIVCCDKLKLDSKKDRYYSMLYDFFEAV